MDHDGNKGHTPETAENQSNRTAQRGGNTGLAETKNRPLGEAKNERH